MSIKILTYFLIQQIDFHFAVFLSNSSLFAVWKKRGIFIHPLSQNGDHCMKYLFLSSAVLPPNQQCRQLLLLGGRKYSRKILFYVFYNVGFWQVLYLVYTGDMMLSFQFSLPRVHQNWQRYNWAPTIMPEMRYLVKITRRKGCCFAGFCVRKWLMAREASRH